MTNTDSNSPNSVEDTQYLGFTAYPVEVCGADFYITATTQTLKILRAAIDAAIASTKDEVLVKSRNVVMNPSGIGHYIFIHKLDDKLTSDRWLATGGTIKNSSIMYNFTELPRKFIAGETTLRYPWFISTSIENVEV